MDGDSKVPVAGARAQTCKVSDGEDHGSGAPDHDSSAGDSKTEVGSASFLHGLTLHWQGRGRRGGGKAGVGQVQRPQDPLGDQLLDRLAGDRPGDHAQDDGLYRSAQEVLREVGISWAD